ncbi:hypothetical protein ACP70R_005383 [Stipagrostis hirtigluma subsp. patula]
MGLSRRFLNLIAPPIVSPNTNATGGRPRIIRTTGSSSTRRRRPSAAGVEDEEHAASQAELHLPGFTSTFGPAPKDHSKISFFPLTDDLVACADEAGRAFLFHADWSYLVDVPTPLKPKSMAISLFVNRADVDGDYRNDGFGSSIFFMERIPEPEPSRGAQLMSDQFEALIFRYPDDVRGYKAWVCHRLPAPPFVRETFHRSDRPKITSYAVLGGGSDICVSVDGVGTYCMDTTSHTWREAGKWTLPFRGKVEYEPELKLWFGFSAESSRLLAAADLSTMDSQPQLVGEWKELDPPEEWKECKEPQFVSLGSGKFCIVRFFQSRKVGVESDELTGQSFAVFTGVDVVRRDLDDGDGGNGKVELHMVPHKSRRVNGADVETLF